MWAEPPNLRYRFQYVRTNQRPVVMQLFEHCGHPRASYDGKELHGCWRYAFDEALGLGTFYIDFNANPLSTPKPHVFVQIQETEVYRHINEGDANWTVFLIPVKDG